MTSTSKSRAWGRVIDANEFWDGEVAPRRSAKRRFEEEWKLNGPSVVTVHTVTPGDFRPTTTKREFSTRKAADAFADTLDISSWTTVSAARTK